MSSDIRIKKGLSLKLQGEAEKVVADAPASKIYTIKPDDFHGVIPKLIARQGDVVKAGGPLFFSKNNPEVIIAAPVSGVIQEVVRGAKRKILEIRILPDSQNQYQDQGVKDPKQMDGEQVKAHLLQAGCWPFVKQRPYDVVADPNKAPKAIFISGFNSSPLAPDADFILNAKQKEIQAAITAVSKLTTGKVHVTVQKEASLSVFRNIEGIDLHNASGVHPVGNVGVQINQIDPINKGEVVWVLKPEDLVIIGELLLTGKFNPTKVVAITGPRVKSPKYLRVKSGASMADLVAQNTKDGKNRIISGNVLTGTTRTLEQPLGYYDNQVTVLEEGDDYDFFGWNIPRPNKFSLLRAGMFSFLTPNKKYDLNTNTNGEHRAFVVTGHYEKVFPQDIFPMQLLKATLIGDIDEMEALGIYEVAPEDFALTEFICPSKTNQQEIIRKGLDVMLAEVG